MFRITHTSTDPALSAATYVSEEKIRLELLELANKIFATVSAKALTTIWFIHIVTLGAHAQRGYGSWVCLCVCLLLHISPLGCLFDVLNLQGVRAMHTFAFVQWSNACFRFRGRARDVRYIARAPFCAI